MNTILVIGTAHGGMFFSLTYLAAFLLGASIMICVGFKRGYPKDQWLLIILTGVLFFILGDRIFTYSPAQWTEVFTRFDFPDTDKKTVLGGITGLFAGILLAKSWLRFKGPVLDTMAIALPLAMAVSRIGCLMAGCCFGTPTNLPWGIQYDAASLVYHVHLEQGLVQFHDKLSLAVHPAQLYQVIGCLLIAFLVRKSRKHWKSGGSLFLFSVIGYAVLRFLVEFVRAPESNFFTGQFFWGLKIIQWLILGAVLPGLIILFFKEKFAKILISDSSHHSALAVKDKRNLTSKNHISDLRQVILTILLSIFVLVIRKWFDPLEISVIVIFLLPVVIILSVKIFRSHSVAGFRWVIPVMLVCSFSFMAQKSIPELKKGEKITFTDAGVTGMFGSYFEDISKDSIMSGCDGTWAELTPMGTQKRSFYQGGIDVTHNVWRGKYNKFSIGARGFLGFESGGIQTDYPHSQTTIGISPYMTMNWQYFGLGAGLSVGQMKIPFSRSVDSFDNFNSGDIVSTNYINAYVLPSLSLRVGPVDILYAEATFPGLFPSSTPYPLFQAGVGSGLGKTNGTKIGIGYCYKGIYGQVTYPIKNMVVVEALFCDDLQGGENRKRVFSFGIHYRFSIKKTTEDTLKYKSSGKSCNFYNRFEKVKDFDGNVYHTTIIGKQLWMTKNLKVTHFRDGSVIPGINVDTTGKGQKYNWSVVNDDRKLCPDGWHVPSFDDWTTLFYSLGKHNAGKKLQGGFSCKGKESHWWSSTEQDSTHVKSFHLNNKTLEIMFVGSDKTSDLSVRCIKDQN
jgi:prolipoprotein diacylglyceryltransferase